MTAQASLPYNALSGSHRRNPGCSGWWRFPAALHAMAFVVLWPAADFIEKYLFFPGLFS